jgi:hypothetical protein
MDRRQRIFLLLSALSFPALAATSASGSDCPELSAPLPGEKEASALVDQLVEVTEKLPPPPGPCGTAASPAATSEEIAKQAAAIQLAVERIEAENKIEADRQRKLEEWLSKNLDARMTGLFAARLDLARQIADHDRMVADREALDSHPKIRSAYDAYLKQEKVFTHLTNLVALGRLDRASDSNEVKRSRQESVRFLASPEVGIIGYRDEAVHQPSSSLSAWNLPRQQAVPYFKASNSPTPTADDVITQNQRLVEASGSFLKSAEGKISAEALQRFRDHGKSLVREGISLGADLSENEHTTTMRNAALGYLTFEAATWLIPVGRLGAAAGGRIGAAAVGTGAHSVSAVQAIKTVWNSGKALRTLSTTEKLQRMAKLSAAGAYSGAVIGGGYSVADKAIDAIGREDDYLCALAAKYEKDGGSARMAITSGLLGAGAGGGVALLPRLGLLLGGAGAGWGGHETTEALSQAQSLYRSGDEAGALRELSKAGLIGGTTLIGVRSSLRALRSEPTPSSPGRTTAGQSAAAPADAPAAPALGSAPASAPELDGLTFRPRLYRPDVPVSTKVPAARDAPPLARRANQPTTSARQQVLENEWVTIDRILETKPDLASQALASSKIRNLRGLSSNTVRRNSAAEKVWLEADAAVQRWAKNREPVTLDRIIALNNTLRNHYTGDIEVLGLRRGFGSNVYTNQAARQKPSSMSPEEFEALPRVGDGKALRRTYVRSRRVEQHLDDFDQWMKQAEAAIEAGTAHPIDVAAEAYQRLVSIHPFTDGNGRTTRFVMEWILLKNGYPPPVLNRPRKNVAVFEDSLAEDRNVSAGAAQVKITQGIRETIRMLQD